MPIPPTCLARATLGFLAAAAAAAAGCGGAPPAPRPVPPPPVVATSAPTVATPTTQESSPAHGVDVAAMDRSISPGADFYAYANGAWLRSAEIPADRSATGPFVQIDERLENRMRAILEECASSGAKAGTPSQRVGDYYASFLDEGAIEAKGLAPLQPALRRIAKIADARGLSAALGADLRADVDPLNNTKFDTDHLFGLWAEQDLNDPSRVAPYLLQGGLGMPDRSYYLDPTPQMDALRTRYRAYVKGLLELAGMRQPDATAARVFELEKKIAAAHVAREESEDVKKANNPWSRKDFSARAPGIDWDAFFKAARLDGQGSFIVWHPAAVAGLSALVRSQPLATWKEYLTVRALSHAARFLPRAFAERHFAFYDKALRGTPRPRERWKLALDRTNDALDEVVGRLYVERHFPPKYRADIDAMAEEIRAALARRIDALPWMSAETKAKAKVKLAALRVGVGYPEVWRDDTGLEIVRGDALGNAERAERFRYEKALAKLGKPADRGAWAMSPQTDDAVNLPVRNELEIPAGILDAPYYDPDATAAVKFGAIGATIGHEISHSFDDQGAQFDVTGRLASWWMPDDFAHFEASGAALAKQYDGYRPFPDLSVNGRQTLSENIADLAGLAAAYDAWNASLKGASAAVVDGLTGDQQFFVSYCQSWQEKDREPALREAIASNGHAPAPYRALTVRNLDAWYAAFGVKPGDPLYLDPGARVRVW
jgi:putative endopeptidase